MSCLDDMNVQEFPWVWLRDNCQCSKCYEPISQCRIVNLTEWDLDIRPRDVQVEEMVVMVVVGMVVVVAAVVAVVVVVVVVVVKIMMTLPVCGPPGG